MSEPVRSGTAGTLAGDGFLVLPAAIPAALVAEAVAALGRAGDATRPFADPGLRGPSQRLQFAPAIVAALREALDDEPLAMTCNYFLRSPALPDPDRSALGPHTHDREVVTRPAGRFLLCWTALQDIERAQGPMWIAPGSHRRALPLQSLLHRRLRDLVPGELERMRRAFAAGVAESELPGLMDRYHAELDRLLVEETGSIRPVLLRAGDAILFDPALVHGTLPPERGDPAPPRLSFLSRYAGRDAALFVLPPWTEGAEPDERWRLPDRASDGPAGYFYRDYVPARLALLGVRRGAADVGGAAS